MDLKKRLREFFSLKRKAGGFTLVELVVVIAILAILAGVAVPVYSGYITKANEAADNQLLNAVNKAFASACMVHGVDNYDATGVAAPISNGVVGTVTAYGIDDFDDTFKEFYDGGTFKVYTALKYVADLGMFEGLGAGDARTLEYTLSTGEKVTLNYDEAALGAFKGSAYADYSRDGSLLTNVDMVVDWAVDKAGNSLLAGVAEDPNFNQFASEVLKKDYGSMTGAEQMNALVLYTAQKTDSVNSATVLNTLMTNTSGGLINPGGDDDATKIAGYAMQYALALAYYREQNPTVSNPDVNAVLSSMNERDMIENPETGEPTRAEKTKFQYWLAQNGQTNLDGYLGAMGLIADNTANVPADQLLADGYENDDLKGILNQLLGNSGS